MAKKKLIRFTENIAFTHLVQPRYSELHPAFWLRGRWGVDFFKNDNPITLELGCGKGEYTVGLAREYRNRNFIGIDIKGARLWRGCKIVQEEHLSNAGFIRSRADHIENLFGAGEVAEIWLTFPDPQSGKERKRLTAPVFIDRYQRILKAGGIVHLKTDDSNLFSYTKEILKHHAVEILLTTENLYHEFKNEPAARIQTFYESIWLSQDKKIAYLRFRFNNKPVEINDI